LNNNRTSSIAFYLISMHTKGIKANTNLNLLLQTFKWRHTHKCTIIIYNDKTNFQLNNELMITKHSNWNNNIEGVENEWNRDRCHSDEIVERDRKLKSFDL